MDCKPPSSLRAHQSPWLCVLCLIGLDYFSSLAYQPSIAFEVAGWLAPLATLTVILLTFVGALPIYIYVAGRSPHGLGAVGLLERSVRGWPGKLLVVVLLGFAATDFVITRTLSVADAAHHLLGNPEPHWQAGLDSLAAANQEAMDLVSGSFWHKILKQENRQLVVTILLSVLGFLFWAVFRRGFTRRVVQISVVVVSTYLLLNAVVIGSCLAYLYRQQDLLQLWWGRIERGYWHPAAGPLPPQAWGAIALLCLLAFPQMALGMSGFELSMVVMPLVRGDDAEEDSHPRRRIRNARKLLFVAAAIMAVYLLGSALVTTVLLEPSVLSRGGPAENRALAYLAHGGLLLTGDSARSINPVFGPWFGTFYDVVTILILSLAGASVTIGLRDLVPRYLHRLGMELNWAHRLGATLLVFNCINLAVTVIFRASVTEQRGAYATAVLTFLASAGLTAALDTWRRRSGWRVFRVPWFFVLVSAGFFVAAAATVFVNPRGLLIALAFVAVILFLSIISRAFRSTEPRLEGFVFKDSQSQFLWDSLKYLEFPVLVPHRPGRHSLVDKEAKIRQRHRLPAEVPVVFVEADLDDASDFYQKPVVQVAQEDGRFVLHISGCASIPHVLAAVALELTGPGQPPEMHFGWSNESPIDANLSFLLFGEGNVPWMVRELICKAQPNPERRPRVVVG